MVHFITSTWKILTSIDDPISSIVRSFTTGIITSLFSQSITTFLAFVLSWSNGVFEFHCENISNFKFKNHRYFYFLCSIKIVFRKGSGPFSAVATNCDFCFLWSRVEEMNWKKWRLLQRLISSPSSFWSILDFFLCDDWFRKVLLWAASPMCENLKFSEVWENLLCDVLNYRWLGSCLGCQLCVLYHRLFWTFFWSVHNSHLFLKSNVDSISCTLAFL